MLSCRPVFCFYTIKIKGTDHSTFKKPFMYQFIKWRNLFSFLTGLLLVSVLSAQPATINVDLTKETGEMKPIWAWWGYDEPNYTYMKDGRKLLSEFAALSPVPVFIRA